MLCIYQSRKSTSASNHLQKEDKSQILPSSCRDWPPKTACCGWNVVYIVSPTSHSRLRIRTLSECSQLSLTSCLPRLETLKHRPMFKLRFLMALSSSAACILLAFTQSSLSGTSKPRSKVEDVSQTTQPSPSFRWLGTGNTVYIFDHEILPRKARFHLVLGWSRWGWPKSSVKQQKPCLSTKNTQ